jgi:hypothetical protein
MIEFVIKYGQYAGVVTGVLLVYSAFDREKRGPRDLYIRLVIGAAGAFLIYFFVRKALDPH